jgi:hypothetical protein
MTLYHINDTDKVSKKSNIRQLVDILQVDIASKYDDSETITQTHTRKKYEVFVTGGQDTSGTVTSGLYQTVFDQNHTYQTSNEMLDITIGSYADEQSDGDFIVNGITVTPDASGKLDFTSDTLMMREKVSMYQQYAQALLGKNTDSFVAPFNSDTASDRIDYALFINFKRLFIRDGMEKEQFSIKIHKDCPFNTSTDNIALEISPDSDDFNLYSDANATNNLSVSTISGNIGHIVDDSGDVVGLIFYHKGIVVLDAERVFTANNTIKGSISSVNDNSNVVDFEDEFTPNFWVSGSVDNIIDHIADTRFGRDNKSAVGFINQTSINSSLYFCRVGPNDANFSTNPSYIDESGSIMCIQDKGDDPFAYVTTIGLYDAAGELLAVAKTSRPIEKNPEVDLSISVRIDY